MTAKKVRAKDGIERTGRIIAWCAATGCLTPIVLVCAVATTRVWQQGPIQSGFTLEWIIQSWRTISPYATFSIQLSVLTLAIDFIIGVPTSWVLARHRFPGRELLLSLTNVPIAIPGIAMGLALIIAYPMLRRNGFLLVAGHVLYTLPFFIASVTPQLGARSVRDAEEVAATLGATFPKRVIHVIYPHIRTSLLAAAIMVVTLSLGEFNISFFLFNPRNKPLPVELYSAYITGRIEVAAAVTLWFLCFVVPATLLLERLGGAKAGQA